MISEARMINNKRINYIDTAKCIGIFLMILGHSGLTGNMLIYIYAFHMPLFFILTGYVTDEYLPKSIIAFSVRRIKTLLVPFFCYALMFSHESFTKWIYILYGSRNGLAIADTFTPLWFLPCLFSSVIIYQLIINVADKFHEKRNICYWLLIVAVALLGYVLQFDKMGGAENQHVTTRTVSSIINFIGLGYPFCFNVALVGTVFMAIGRVMSKIQIKILVKIILSVVLIVTSLYTYSLNLPLNTLFGIPRVEMCIAVYGNYLLFFFNAIIVSYTIILISTFVTNKILEYLGRNSLLILIGSAITLPIAQAFLHLIDMKQNGLYFFVEALLAFTFTIPFVFLVNYFAPNLAGKESSEFKTIEYGK
jgi:fucose 4-O-acetylase-like acetyltransferase